MRRQWINGLRIELRIISIISLEIMGTKFQKYYNFILKLSYERHVLLSVGWLVSRWGHGSVTVLLEHLMTSFKDQRKKVLRGTIDAQLRAKTVERTDGRT